VIAGASFGDDNKGQIIITTGAGPTAGHLIDVTFASGYTQPIVVISPAADGSGSLQVYASASVAGFTIFAAIAPTAATLYAFDYIVLGP
jgi:hypothetical protein